MIFLQFTEEFNVIQVAGDAAVDVCDYTACNGLTLQINFEGKTGHTLQTELEEKAFTIGQCQYAANKIQYDCFVNENSICPKEPTSFPGIFYSTKPCEDPKAPRPRLSLQFLEFLGSFNPLSM